MIGCTHSLNRSVLTMTRYILQAMALVAGLSLTAADARAQAPVKLSIGYGPASDVTLALLKANPQFATHLGKSYDLDLQEFRGSDMRFRAYLSGALSGATASSNSITEAASKGIDLVIVASISKESDKGFRTTYMVRDDSPIKSLGGLKDKLIGINAHRSSIELWARLAVQKAGLDPERDARYAVVEFPLQGQALRSSQIDVGAFPQPFAILAQSKPGLRVLFTTHDVLPFDQETQLLFLKREVLQKSPGAVRDFLADLTASTRFYLDHSDEARRLLLKEHVIRMQEAAYLQMKDYYRAPDLKFDVDSMRKMQDIQIKAGFQEKTVDFQKIVDLGFLPK
jgi:ABC-type nitrate/sulfonate/bicarbonate transport system substrate-binding protein